MKKIICLIESLGSGGAERQLSGLAVLLKQHGYNVEVWYYSPRHFYSKDLEKENVKFRYIPEAENKYKRLGVIRKELLKAKPDTVITYLNTPSIIGCISKITGGKFNLIVSERNTTQNLGITDRIKFFLYRFADHIVPNSFSQGEFIERHYPNLKNKIKCITNFVDTNKFSPNLNKEPNTKTRILTVARIMPQKNVINYIKAIKKVAEIGLNFEVCWFGSSTSQEYFEECCQTIVEHGLKDTFKFYPATTNIIEEYHKSDIFCLPSIYEGFPNVVCEAMCCGLPIICSDVSDNSRIISNGVNGFLFDPNNVDNMTEIIGKIVATSPQQIESMRLSSIELSRTQFSTKVFVDKYIDLI